MSAGRFVRSIYASDTGETHPIRVQPETLGLTIGGTANSAPPPPASSPLSAKVTGGSRSLGLIARRVSIQFDDGEAPAGYFEFGTLRVPWLDSGNFASIAVGDTGTYLGSPITVIGVSPERRR